MAQDPQQKRPKTYRDRAEAELRNARNAMKEVVSSAETNPAQLAALYVDVAGALALLDLADALRHGQTSPQA